MRVSAEIYKIMKPIIAIIEPKYLIALGLKSLLNDMVPFAEVLIYNNLDDLKKEHGTKEKPKFVHYFVSSDIVFSHSDFFANRKDSAIVLSQNHEVSEELKEKGYRFVNIGASEGELVKALLEVHGRGHKDQRHTSHPSHKQGVVIKENILSEREQDVLKLVAQGYLNKQIAHLLGISITTVITHRKNISEKLGLKSVASLAIYAVVNGLVDYSVIYTPR